MVKKICFLLLAMQLCCLSLPAQDYNALRKLGRGASNISLGWMEVFLQMGKVDKEAGPVAGFFWGLTKGIACAMGRTIYGAYDIVTFPVPSYKPLVEPEFIFSEEAVVDSDSNDSQAEQ
ncbi:MAG: exosortase system-associated protein, TIGR04073 family [Candidatus Omnitrophica bacterium]|nr:exosortase system-associated protein, TIGR04073 family [Candidatus Omnitrophota bacterium]MDD5430115.1 exosortase system-associated protein, TIGR04073 family [Candidatus Omnitrophota bacterium]